LVRIYDHGQTNTHTQTDTLITILRSPIGGGIITATVTTNSNHNSES